MTAGSTAAARGEDLADRGVDSTGGGLEGLIQTLYRSAEDVHARTRGGADRLTGANAQSANRGVHAADNLGGAARITTTHHRVVAAGAAAGLAVLTILAGRTAGLAILAGRTAATHHIVAAGVTAGLAVLAVHTAGGAPGLAVLAVLAVHTAGGAAGFTSVGHF